MDIYAIPLSVRQEVSRCLLCYDPPCSKACPAQNEPDRFIRSLYFQNTAGAVKGMIQANPLSEICAKDCQGKAVCQKACIRGKIDRPVDIPAIQLYAAGLSQTMGYCADRADSISYHVCIIGYSMAAVAAAVFLVVKGATVTVCDNGGERPWAEEKKKILQQFSISYCHTECSLADISRKFPADVYLMDEQENEAAHMQQDIPAVRRVVYFRSDEQQSVAMAVRKGRKAAEQILKDREEGGR